MDIYKALSYAVTDNPKRLRRKNMFLCTMHLSNQYVPIYLFFCHNKLSNNSKLQLANDMMRRLELDYTWVQSEFHSSPQM